MGCNFYIKSKLKSEIFNEKKKKKKKLETKTCFSVKTNNLNWDILTKNLVIFRRWHVVKDEKF